jgi:hypothetical protein
MLEYVRERYFCQNMSGNGTFVRMSGTVTFVRICWGMVHLLEYVRE